MPTHNNHNANRRARNEANNYKTVRCNKLDKYGFCINGLMCPFAHGEYELRSPTIPYNVGTRMCRNGTRAECSYGDSCTFRHPDDPRPFTRNNQVSVAPKSPRPTHEDCYYTHPSGYVLRIIAYSEEFKKEHLKHLLVAIGVEEFDSVRKAGPFFNEYNWTIGFIVDDEWDIVIYL